MFDYHLIFILSIGLCSVLAVTQQTVDPAYLQQFYQQVAAQAGARAANTHSDATPIYEPTDPEPQPQYINPGQQIRIKDNVHDQVRAQQNQSPQHTQAYVAPSVRQYYNNQPSQHQQLQYVSPHQHQHQQQPQSVIYKTAPVAASPKQQLLRRPQLEYQPQDGKLNKEDPEDYDPNPSYQFGFDVKDDEFTNYQNRKEIRDGNVIKGSYSVVDSDGFIRTVKYTADPKDGFKAEVIREPTDIVVKIPTPPPQQQLLRHQLGGHQSSGGGGGGGGVQSSHHQQPQYIHQQPHHVKAAPQPQYQYQ